MKVKIREAAEVLGVSVDTVRRKLRRGELVGEKVYEGGVEIWLVEIPDDSPPPPPSPDDWLRRYVEDLERDRDSWRTMAMTLAAARSERYSPIPLGSGPVQPRQDLEDGVEIAVDARPKSLYERFLDLFR